MTNEKYTRITPWDQRGEELDATQGVYSYFAAWEEWIAKHDTEDVVGGLNSIEKVHLYSMFNKACEEAATLAIQQI